MQRNVRQQGADHPTLRGSRVGVVPDAIFHVARLEPLFDQFPTGNVADGFEQVCMVNVVKCPLDVRVHHPFGERVASGVEIDACDGIMRAPSRSESITGALETRLPRRLKRILDPCLQAPVKHRRDAERSECAVGFRDVHPSGGLCAPRLVGHQLIHQFAPCRRCLDHHLVHARRLLAVVQLRHPPHADERVGVGTQHEPLERADCFPVLPLRGSEDPLPQIADTPV